jgi:TolA-binding protein
VLRLPKDFYRLYVLVLALELVLPVELALARSKNRALVNQSLAPLNAALDANDIDVAQSAAVSIYQQATNAPSLPSPDPTVIIDPVMIADTVGFNRTKVAVEIAQCFYNHAQLDLAKQWALTATSGGSLADEYVRRATVLLGNIATGMDRDNDASAYYLSVITLNGQYREQTAAYAGLLELLMLQKQDELVEQWVRNGQSKFEGAGTLELDFLKAAAKTLKRRNHPLWLELDRQIVELTPAGKTSRMIALRELASNARKFARWAEAETNYAAICAMNQSSPEEIVNSHLFLADCQAKQAEDYTRCIERLKLKIQNFATVEERDYGYYRLAKFYHGLGRDDLAQTNYWVQVSGLSTSSWAAASLHQLGVLKEKEGDFQDALRLYLQYPQRFPQNDRLVMLAYAGALSAADSLGDTNASAKILSTIANRAAAIQDYNVHLNVAYHYKVCGREDLARQFLASGLTLARNALGVASDSAVHSLIHFRVLRRLTDFQLYQKAIDYFTGNIGDLADNNSRPDDYQLQCRCYRAIALASLGQKQQAMEEIRDLMDRAQANPELEAKFAEILAIYSDKSAATELFEWAANKYPSHPWVNIGRLELAVQKYNAGDCAAAQKLAADIINSLRENHKMAWIHRLYWEAVYLRGCCLQTQGKIEEGAQLKQTAFEKSPDLPIQNRLGLK